MNTKVIEINTLSKPIMTSNFYIKNWTLAEIKKMNKEVPVV